MTGDRLAVIEAETTVRSLGVVTEYGSRLRLESSGDALLRIFVLTRKTLANSLSAPPLPPCVRA
jgi:hypothetical protein